MDTKEQYYFLAMVRAVSDMNRLTMLRILAQNERSISQLASEMSLPESAVVGHIKQLHSTGFLQLRMADNQQVYRFNPQPITRLQDYIGQLGQPLAQIEPAVSDNRWIDELDFSDEEKKILVGHTFNGRLTHFPTKDKQWFAILRWIAAQFEMGVRYPEKQVNAIITTIHEDYATIRRSLVEFGFMARERGGGDYWRIPQAETMIE